MARRYAIATKVQGWYTVISYGGIIRYEKIVCLSFLDIHLKILYKVYD